MASYTIDASTALEFYSKNNVIFITGGSGFIGITLIEKILRSLPQVTKIYALLRASKKATLNDRFEEVINSRVFETLRSNYSSEEIFREKIASKIVPIQGDVSLDGLGMNQNDMEMILSDTNIIIHSAATVQFYEPLGIPLNTNTRGTFRVIDLAKKMPNLVSFNHISTAYVIPRGYAGRCMESVQPLSGVKGTPEEVYKMLSNMSEKEMAAFELEVLESYPNTYSFSKALTENLIHSRYKELKLPIVITRPTSVVSAMSEPSVGWTRGLGTMLPKVKSTALGQAQEWAGNKMCKMDYIPVDYVCKTILAATVTADSTTESPKFYTVGTSHNHCLHLRDVGKNIEKYWRSVPAPKKRTSNDIRCEYYPFEEHKRRFEQAFGEKLKKARMDNDLKTVKIIEGIYTKTTMYYTYFMEALVFDITNGIQLDCTAPKELQSDLRFDMDWEDYIHRICFGVHKYTLGEPVEFYPRSNEISARL